MMNKVAIVETIMTNFAKRTCIRESSCVPKRYLWTDAFAVCNFLELYRQTGLERYREDALLLVDQVHHVLGRHRSDDSRSGWISGLDDREAELHPTIGGLRIGKALNERKEDEPQNERLEWEQDGQYFHYLTKWMHALNLVTEVTEDPKYNRWAIELAKTAYEKFTYLTPYGARRMFWKMSIDLSYPLVSSMGQHDALDGYITYLALQKTAERYENFSDELDISPQIEGLYQMASSMGMDTTDPLGLGGLLSDACILAQLDIVENSESTSNMLFSILDHARQGIGHFLAEKTVKYPAQYRLAFRELGLSIGLHAVEIIKHLLEEHELTVANEKLLRSLLGTLGEYSALHEYIEAFWQDSENQKSNTWIEHLDINAVMLATSLMPDGYLRIEWEDRS
ncbi:hypothetical protein [Sulfurovum sp. NBC37-1]|uniref:hypothetical protein n=1 Tax=Sulfurovum sp. (strain NBC37-1) TaxID=387093 RepID=UPI0002E17A15|nr:hypothetical protein [Sulfurovum sp. NBC37-1]